MDVAASNGRAVQCYVNVGFHDVDEIWRTAPDLADQDLSESKYDFLRAHVRARNALPELRFRIMEARKSDFGPAASADR